VQAHGESSSLRRHEDYGFSNCNTSLYDFYEEVLSAFFRVEEIKLVLSLPVGSVPGSDAALGRPFKITKKLRGYTLQYLTQ